MVNVWNPGLLKNKGKKKSNLMNIVISLRRKIVTKWIQKNEKKTRNKSKRSWMCDDMQQVRHTKNWEFKERNWGSERWTQWEEMSVKFRKASHQKVIMHCNFQQSHSVIVYSIKFSLGVHYIPFIFFGTLLCQLFGIFLFTVPTSAFRWVAFI